MLIVFLLWLGIRVMVFLRNVIIVAIFTAVLSIALYGVALNTCPISFLPLRIAKLLAFHLIHPSFLHNFDRLVIVEVSLVLIVNWVVVTLLIVVILFLYGSLRPIICFIVVPSQGKRTGASWSLNYLFVCLAIKVSVVRTIFIEHDALRYRNIIN